MNKSLNLDEIEVIIDVLEQQKKVYTTLAESNRSTPTQQYYLNLRKIVDDALFKLHYMKCTYDY